MPTMTNAQRAMVVATAKSLFNEGCHFVNGEEAIHLRMRIPPSVPLRTAWCLRH